jgi:hypothetical protein
MSSNTYLTVRLHCTETSKQLEYSLGEMGAPATVLQPTGTHNSARNMYELSRYTDQVTK